jgi:hypothetical protein
MAFTPVLGWAERLGIGDTVPVTTEMDFLNPIGLTPGREFRDFSGIRGSTSRPINRVRDVGGTPGGTFNCRPTPTVLAILLKYIRSAGSGSPLSYPFAETNTAFALSAQLGTKRHDWTGCKLSRAEFSATKGSALQVALSCMSTGYTSATASFPAISISEATKPWIFEDATNVSTPKGIYVGGTAVDCFDWSVAIDRALSPRLVNSLRPTGLNPTDHIVTWNLVVPYGDNAAIYEGLAETGQSCVAGFVGPTHTLVFNSPKVCFQPVLPTAQDRDENRLTLTGQAFWSAAVGDELVVQLDTNGLF